MSDGPLGGPTVREWLERLRERVEHEMGDLRAIPGVDVRVLSAPVGSSSDFQGHDVRVEVTLANGESLGLSVTSAYLTTEPRLFADVTWSHGNVVASTWPGGIADEWPLATAANLHHLEQDLPRLLTAMRDAYARGRRQQNLRH